MAIAPISVGDTNARAKMNDAIAKANLVDGKASAAALTAGLAAEASARQAAIVAEAATLRSDILGLPLPMPVQHRPGDAPLEFGRSLADGEADGIAPVPGSLLRYDEAGKVVRLTGDDTVAPRHLFALEPGRRYLATFAVQRRVNSPDPDNDAIRCAFAWYGQGKGRLLATPQTVAQDLLGLTTGSGRQVVRAVVSRAAGGGVDIVAPAGARYVRPYVQTYGTLVQNDIEVINWADITDAIAFAPDVSALADRVGAIESLDLGDRLSAAEAQLTAPDELRLKTLGDFDAADVPVSVDTVEVLGYFAVSASSRARYRRVATEPDGHAKRQSLDGAWWALDEEIWTPGMFGSPENGVLSDSAALNRMFESAPSGKRIRFAASQYILDATVNIPRGVDVDCHGAKFLITANVTGFEAIAQPSQYALTADYVAGGMTLAVEPMTAPLKAGQHFKILSNAVDPANRDQGSSALQYRAGEWACATTGGTLTSIQLRAPLRFPRGIDPVSSVGEEVRVQSYSMTYNARVLVLSSETLRWSGGEIAFEEGHDADWAAPALTVAGFFEPTIRGLTISRGYQIGLNLVGNCAPVVEACNFSNLNNNTSLGQYGYGVADASYMSKIVSCHMTEVRHGYTTNAVRTYIDDSNVLRLLSAGRTMGGRVIGCSGSAGSESLFDTHHDAEDVVFNSCTVNGGSKHAYTLRGRGVVIDACEALNTRYGVYVQTEFNTGLPDGDLWTSGKPEGFTTAEVRGFKARVRERPFHISRSRSCRIVGGDILSSNHRLIYNEGSGVALDGDVHFVVTDYDGAGPIVEETNCGILDIRNQDESFSAYADWSPFIRILNGADIRIDAKKAKDEAFNNIYLMRTQSAECLIEIRGNVRADLSTAFSRLVPGVVDSYNCSPNSMIRWSIYGAADNAITTDFLNGKRIIAEAVDGSLRYDGVGRSLPGPYANDVAASAAGVSVGVCYRLTGGGVAWRQI